VFSELVILQRSNKLKMDDRSFKKQTKTQYLLNSSNNS